MLCAAVSFFPEERFNSSAAAMDVSEAAALSPARFEAAPVVPALRPHRRWYWLAIAGILAAILLSIF
jgi:hypothetical protein